MTPALEPIKAPFPWFGGKSRAAEIIWARFGNVPNYVEPFAGSLAVLLDPPYSADEHSVTYSAASDVAAQVREWAIANGDNHQLRIALCGYEGEHPMPMSWECVPWKARGGYGSQSDGRGRENSARERIWFSPACIQKTDQLFPT